MLRHIVKEIKDFDPVLHQVYCFGYNLNHITQAFLFGSTAKQKKGRKDKNKVINIAI